MLPRMAGCALSVEYRAALNGCYSTDGDRKIVCRVAVGNLTGALRSPLRRG